jgi:hypothetical protein
MEMSENREPRANITVEAVSTKNRTIKVAETGRWEKVAEGVDLSVIEKGRSYQITYQMKEGKGVTITGFINPNPPSTQQEQDGPSTPAKKTAGSALETAMSAQQDKELRITRLAAIERAISYLNSTRGVVFSLADVFNIAEQMTYYAYNGITEELKMELTGIPAAIRRNYGEPSR